MKVQNLLEHNFFEDFKVIAGQKGLGRKLTTVSVMDAPDIYKWMKGGEFLLTTGYIMKEEPILIRDLIVNLDKRGASALGIKLNRFIDELPKEVIEIADKLNFPIIYIPLKYSFVDIINPVLSEVVNNQARKLEYSHMVHTSFTKLVIEGGSIQKIITTLSKIIQRNIIYYDKYFEKYYFGNINEDILFKINENEIEYLFKKCSYYPIFIDNVTFGYIFIYHKIKEIEEYVEIGIEHASTILKLEIQKKISNLQIEKRYRDEFVQDLLLNNIKSEQEIINRAKTYDWNFKDQNIVIIFDIDDFKRQYLNVDKFNKDKLEEVKEKIFTYIKNNIKLRYKNAIYTNFSDSIVFVFSLGNNEISSFKKNINSDLKTIKEYIKKLYEFTLTIGLGAYKRNAIEINISYEEAKKSIIIARNIYYKDSIMLYEELGIYKLFYKLCGEKEMEDFYKQYLCSLIDYDDKNNTNFLYTLKCIYESDWNLKLTSQKMFIHYNTIKYRFNKIAEILGMDLRSSENKLNIAVALKLSDMTK